MDNYNLCALVIDDNEKSQRRTVRLLRSNPLVNEATTASDTNEAILKIINSSPDVILMNYPSRGSAEKEMFELVKTKLPDSCIAFVSDTTKFAKTAIQNGIYNYLLKPVSGAEINKLIESALEKKQSNIQARLDQVISSNPHEVKLKFLTINGYIFFSPDELVFCKATGYCTELYLTNHRKEISHLSLVKFEEKMTGYDFIRISRFHLINPKFIKRIYKKGNMITLSSDGNEYEMKVGKAQIKKLGNYGIE